MIDRPRPSSLLFAVDVIPAPIADIVAWICICSSLRYAEWPPKKRISRNLQNLPAKSNLELVWGTSGGPRF